MSRPCTWFPYSIRRKLSLLLLIVFLPAFGITIISGLEDRTSVIKDANDDALLLVESLADQQEQFVAGTRQMLSTLARLPQVQKREAGACSELFRELIAQHPFYSTIEATTPDGEVFARAQPFESGSINLSEQKHVREAMESLDFSVGECITGKLLMRPTIHYSYPVVDAGGHLAAIIIAGFKLDEYARFSERANLPEGSAVMIMDHRGRRLYRLPENEASPLGAPVPDSSLEKIVGKAEGGVYEDTGADGVYRIYAFRQMRLRQDMSPYMYMVVGIPKDPILQRASRAMLNDLALLGISVLIAVALAWVFGNRLLAEPIGELVRATKELAGGKMEVRTGLPHTYDELGRLAESFDRMASLLQIRSIERDKSEEALLEIAQRFQFAVDSGKLGIWDWDIPSDVLTWNERQFELFGISRESFTANSEAWEKCLHPEDRTETLEAVRAALRGEKKYDTEYRIVRPDGTVRAIKSDAMVIRDREDKAIRMVGLNRDMTEEKQAEDALRDSERELRLLSSRLLSAQEEERKRIAHELHDSIGASLGTIRLSLANTLNRMQEGTAAPESIQEAIALVEYTVEGAREIYMNLRPSILDHLGIIPTIKWFCRQFESAHPALYIEKRIEADEEQIAEPVKLVIFRIMQESFHNVGKYSQADHVCLSLTEEGGSIELTVSDNGVGFDLDVARTMRREKGGLGLTGMRERAQLSGGTFSIESTIRKGTTVRASWPVSA